MVFVPITPELSSAFGTPISLRMVASAERINTGLERAILKRRDDNQGNRISNVGGWQSLPDVLDWPEPEVKLLMEEVDRSIQLISGLPHCSLAGARKAGSASPTKPMAGRM
jgi:hypothetical protein